MFGTRDKWNALNPEEKSAEWTSFHEANAIGTADELYFYEVMMADFLVDYVGH